MFSFKINKKVSSTSAPVVQKSLAETSSSKKAFQDEDDKEDDEPDFIDGLEGTKIVSKNKKIKEKKAALVIPLISKNEWRIGNKDEGPDNENPEGSEVPSEHQQSASLQDQAVKELLQEASSKKDSDKKSSKTIPILFQNRVPDGYEEDDNMDVSLRPDQSSLDDYEAIPIEEFGLAMLRGMGWKETEGIGLKNKKVVDMAEPKLRPKGMGLGAEVAHLNKDVAPKSSSGANEQKEDLSFKIGGYAVITKGSKKGYYGQIESFDEDNNRVIMKLGISGKMETVSKFYVNVVSVKEYKKNSKVINSEKYEEFKAKQDKKERQRHEENAGAFEDDSRRRKNKSETSDSDSEGDYRSRSKAKRSNKDGEDSDYDDDRNESSRKSGHKDRNENKSKTSSDRDRRRNDYEKDRYSSSRHDDRRYEDRDRDRGRTDDSYRNSSHNGHRRSDHDRDNYHRSRKDDHRDRRRRDD